MAAKMAAVVAAAVAVTAVAAGDRRNWTVAAVAAVPERGVPQRRASEATAARASMAARGEAAGAMARAATIGMAAATTAAKTAAAAGDSVAGDSPVALRCVDACARGEVAGESGCSTSLWTHKLVSGSSRSYLDGSCRWSR